MGNSTALIDPGRIWVLMKIAYRDDWRPYFMSGFIIGLLLLISNLFMGFASPGFFLNLMLAVGVVLSSKSFADIHKREHGIYTLMLPASSIEKFLVRLIAGSLGFFVYAVVVCVVAQFLSEFIQSILSNSPVRMDQTSLLSGLEGRLTTYLLFQSVFFLGSLFFRSNSFLKTALLVAAVSFLLMLSAGLLLKYSLVQSHVSGFYVEFDSLDSLREALGIRFGSIVLGIRVLVFGVLPALLYVGAFFKFKSIQI